VAISIKIANELHVQIQLQAQELSIRLKVQQRYLMLDFIGVGFHEVVSLIAFCPFAVDFIILTPSTHYSRGRYCLSACLSVCDSVCPHDRTKTAGSKITKLGTGIVHQDTLRSAHQ